MHGQALRLSLIYVHLFFIRATLNRRTIDILASLLLIAALVACSTLPIGTITEPPVIIVRNSTGADLAKATLSEAAGGNRAFQYGSISPVPRGSSQIFV